MKILLINNHGGGWADFIEVPAATTVAELFTQKMGTAQPENFLIRVNRLPVSQDQVLQENDRVSITSTRIEGAAA
ncbi:MAG: molybdopterin converting factor [Planctomycetes bacterium]|nr:molybdopterin converting factor [Planctomycetota bacterium]